MGSSVSQIDESFLVNASSNKGTVRRLSFEEQTNSKYEGIISPKNKKNLGTVKGKVPLFEEPEVMHPLDQN